MGSGVILIFKTQPTVCSNIFFNKTPCFNHRFVMLLKFGLNSLDTV